VRVKLWDDIIRRLFSRDPALVGRQGAAAARWLEDETLNAALAEIRNQAIEVWAASRDPETRERAWLMFQQTDLFTSALDQALTRKEIQDTADSKR
jgi:hypothetical protein